MFKKFVFPAIFFLAFLAAAVFLTKNDVEQKSVAGSHESIHEKLVSTDSFHFEDGSDIFI